MSFAAPLFLLVGLAAAIPVVLHLVNRRRARQAVFPTLRFLKISVEQTRRRKRIHDVLLMLLRAAILLLIALGLAGPTVTKIRLLFGRAHTAAVIVLDNSTSMGMADGARTRFETATAAAFRILDELGDGDQVGL
ncbi:MAG: BatA and WFA domain-containing protein, partial [Thermoguttaceae bacterium]